MVQDARLCACRHKDVRAIGVLKGSAARSRSIVDIDVIVGCRKLARRPGLAQDSGSCASYGSESVTTRALTEPFVADRKGWAVCAGMLPQSEIHGCFLWISYCLLTECVCCGLPAFVAPNSAEIELSHSTGVIPYHRQIEARFSGADGITRRRAVGAYLTLLHACGRSVATPARIVRRVLGFKMYFLQ